MRDELKGVKYTVVEERNSCDEYGNITSYGIAVRRDGHQLDEVDDVSLDKESVKKLVDMFNELELSIVHFRDVLEDMLP